MIGILAAIVVCSSSGWIAMHWVRPDALPQTVVRDALLIMGCVVALQWPLSLYQGGLIGLQRQVRLNVIKIIAVTASSFGSIYVLKFVSPTITAFFLWQMFVSACHVTAVVFALWLALPKGTRAPRIDFKLLRDVMPFAGGMTGIALFGLVLTEMDKVLLSKLLSLEIWVLRSGRHHCGRAAAVYRTDLYGGVSQIDGAGRRGRQRWRSKAVSRRVSGDGIRIDATAHRTGWFPHGDHPYLDGQRACRR